MSSPSDQESDGPRIVAGRGSFAARGNGPPDADPGGSGRYLDFEIEIQPGTGSTYPLSVIQAPTGRAQGTMQFPYDRLGLENRLQSLQLALLRSGGRRRSVRTPEEDDVQGFGRALYDALFVGEVRSLYETSYRLARRSGKGLRLKLTVLPPELVSVPWEYLYDHRRAEYLSLSGDTPIVRFLALERPVEPLVVSPPLRVLGMIPSPVNLPPLDAERERRRVDQAIAPLQARGLIELTWLPGQTWRDLQSMLRTGPWHIFHFIGHGNYDRTLGQGVVALADDDGQAHNLSATELGRLLGDHHPLRLVLLNSCMGARGSDRDRFSSTAAALVRRGLPAVLAMQDEITDDGAVEFARAFYEALADGYPVDAAVAEARKAVSLAVTNTLEWGTPVLYTRAPQGVIFEIPAPASARGDGGSLDPVGATAYGMGHETPADRPSAARSRRTGLILVAALLLAIFGVGALLALNAFGDEESATPLPSDRTEVSTEDDGVAVPPVTDGPDLSDAAGVGAYTGCADIRGIRSIECQSLVDLFRATNGEGWLPNEGDAPGADVQRNWLQTDAPCFEGADTGWYGVACSGGRVTGLFLADHNLTGSVPASFVNLDGLQDCFLHDNPGLSASGSRLVGFLDEHCLWTKQP